MSLHRLLLCFCIGMVAGQNAAAQLDPLPQPLTLEQALTYVDEAHPNMVLSQSRVNSARADLLSAKSNNGFNILATASARWVEPPEALEAMGRDDHRLVLQASKSIYDFGRTGNLVDSANANISAQEKYLAHARMLRRYDIMAAYFDVILADIRFARDNEDMAISYIRFDRTRDRQELGQFSDIDVLEANASYQEVRRRRMQSESLQRVTRTRLAEILNRPTSIPSKVVPPKLDYGKRKLPDVEKLKELAHTRNLEILALKEEISASKSRMATIQSEYWPKIEAQVDLGVYSREIGSNDLWRAGINIDVPLYLGGSVGAKKSQQLAQINSIEAQLISKKREIDNVIVELWLTINDLKIKQEEAQAKYDYRELYLDRARALYEMEVKTDLGDAMVELTQANLDAASVMFEQALAWERLDILTGGHLKEIGQ